MPRALPKAAKRIARSLERACLNELRTTALIKTSLLGPYKSASFSHVHPYAARNPLLEIQIQYNLYNKDPPYFYASYSVYAVSGDVMVFLNKAVSRYTG